MKNSRWMFFLLLVLPAGMSRAQMNEQMWALGLELGPMNSLLLSYVPINQMQITFSTGPAFQLGESKVFRHVGITVKYFISNARTSGFIGVSALVDNYIESTFFTSLPVGAQHFVTPDIAVFGRISPGLMGPRSGQPGIDFDLGAGVGVSVYLR